MLVLIIGENGSGKTLIMVLLALSVLDKNILANFFIKHPNYQKLHLHDFLNIKEGTDVFIDEAYNWLEKRRSSKGTNIYISQIKEQKRKTNSTWYVSEQRERLIDFRFEEHANIVIECKTRYPIGYSSTEDFHYKISYEDLSYPVYKTLSYKDAFPYFSMFDTKEIIEPENKQKLEFVMIKDNPDLLFPKVISLGKMMEKTYKPVKKKDVSHPIIKWECLKNKIILDYEPYLYIYFQDKIKNNRSE